MPRRPTRSPREAGVTVTEVLVVMVVIAVISAIAIPQVLSQRQKAQENAVQADVLAVADALLATYQQTRTYPSSSQDLLAAGARVSSGTTVQVVLLDADFVIAGCSPETQKTMWFDSRRRGLVAENPDPGSLSLSDGDCPDGSGGLEVNIGTVG